MADYTIDAKLKQKNTFDIDGHTQGVKFVFASLDGLHEETLMLKSNGEPNPDAARSPLYGLQAVDINEKVRLDFDAASVKRHDVRDGQRDRVLWQFGLRLSGVHPAANGNGKAS